MIYFFILYRFLRDTMTSLLSLMRTRQYEQYSFSANSLSIDGTNARTVQKVSAVGCATMNPPPGQYPLCIVGVYSSKP
jgi:hypothetical protein